MDFETQLRAAGLPADAQVTRHSGPHGEVFRVTHAGRGAELLLTDEARHMYGDGPSVALVLGRLAQAVADGLPEGEAGTYPRIVFLGD